jgi:hypothetical protein
MMEYIGVFMLGAGTFFVLEWVYDRFLWRSNANKTNDALRAEIARVEADVQSLRGKAGGH